MPKMICPKHDSCGDDGCVHRVPHDEKKFYQKSYCQPQPYRYGSDCPPSCIDVTADTVRIEVQHAD